MSPCPSCRTLVSAAALDRLGGLCVSCLTGFLLEGDVVGAQPELPLEIGMTFHGLDVQDVLGWGGMGVVYKCHRRDLDRTVALKILNPVLAEDEEFARRFNGEARALAALNHPNIVQVHDFGRENDLTFLVMEYVDGDPLRKLMRDKALTPERMYGIVSETCVALEYAHSRGVVHRDIKPENILVDRRGGVKIADFGLAKMAGLADQAATRDSRVLGTPHYVAPELLAKEHSDHRADIYSVGVLFYEMLTGEVPAGKFPSPSSDPRVEAVVLKCLERNPSQRFSSAADLKSRVDALLVAPARPRRRRSIYLIPVVVVLLAGGALYLLKSDGPKPPSGIDKWHWVNRGEIATTTGDEIAVPPYRDVPIITAGPEGNALGDDSILRFKVRYEVNLKDEPWIMVLLDGTRERGGNSRAIIFFPQGDHKIAYAHHEASGNFTLVHLDPLPKGRPAPGTWHEVEVSWQAEEGRIGVKVDGETAMDRELSDGEELAGGWRFAFGGAAKGVRIKDVRILHRR